MPNPHFNISITQRNRGQSAVAGAAYQSGDRLFSEHDQKYKDYSRKQSIVYTEIMMMFISVKDITQATHAYRQYLEASVNPGAGLTEAFSDHITTFTIIHATRETAMTKARYSKSRSCPTRFSANSFAPNAAFCTIFHCQKQPRGYCGDARFVV